MNLSQNELFAYTNQKLLLISILNVLSIPGQLKSPQSIRYIGVFPLRFPKIFLHGSYSF